MTLDDIPLFSMLKSRMGYLNERQQVVAQNVANSDTPGYTPHDLKPFAFSLEKAGAAAGGGLALTPVQTEAQRIIPFADTPKAPDWRAQSSPDSETKLDGNQVVLEEQMMKMSQSRSDYDAAVTFYLKSLNLLQLAIRTPGKGS